MGYRISTSALAAVFVVLVGISAASAQGDTTKPGQTISKPGQQERCLAGGTVYRLAPDRAKDPKDPTGVRRVGPIMTFVEIEQRGKDGDKSPCIVKWKDITTGKDGQTITVAHGGEITAGQAFQRPSESVVNSYLDEKIDALGLRGPLSESMSEPLRDAFNSTVATQLKEQEIDKEYASQLLQRLNEKQDQIRELIALEEGKSNEDVTDKDRKVNQEIYSNIIERNKRIANQIQQLYPPEEGADTKPPLPPDGYKNYPDTFSQKPGAEPAEPNSSSDQKTSASRFPWWAAPYDWALQGIHDGSKFITNLFRVDPNEPPVYEGPELRVEDTSKGYEDDYILELRQIEEDKLQMRQMQETMDRYYKSVVQPLEYAGKNAVVEQEKDREFLL